MEGGAGGEQKVDCLGGWNGGNDKRREGRRKGRLVGTKVERRKENGRKEIQGET